MTTDRRRTGKPRCRVDHSLIKPCEELVAYGRTIVYFADEEYTPLSREALIAYLEKRKVLTPVYGPRSERLSVIGRIIDRLDVEGIIVKAPSEHYYLWYDSRLQQECDDELEREFGKPAA